MQENNELEKILAFIDGCIDSMPSLTTKEREEIFDRCRFTLADIAETVSEYAIFTSVKFSELTFGKIFSYKTERQVREDFPNLYKENLRQYNHLINLIFEDVLSGYEISHIVSRYAKDFWNVYETAVWAVEIVGKVDILLGMVSCDRSMIIEYAKSEYTRVVLTQIFSHSITICGLWREFGYVNILKT
ncbi:hypothetical protein EBU94_03795 [bacterium]|nr:hypothetical protein [bacterium]